jgi:hypothetical protein
VTAHKYRNAAWTEAELDLIRNNLHLSPIELAKLFEGNRTLAACSQARFRLDGRKAAKLVEYAKKPPGEYIEHLSLFLVEDYECMEIWTRWNGYATWETLGIDERGYVHVRCTAKG